jgi:hypothetical protein
MISGKRRISGEGETASETSLASDAVGALGDRPPHTTDVHASKVIMVKQLYQMGC